MRRVLPYIAILLALSCAPLDRICPGFLKDAFCRPAAAVASQFMNCDYMELDEGYMLDSAGMPVYVTLSCSAVRYFLLMNILLLCIWSELRERMKLSHLVMLTSATYPLTIAVNSIRIVLGWAAGVWASTSMPKDMSYGIHTAVGVIVFLFFLIVLSGLLRWRFCYVRK